MNWWQSLLPVAGDRCTDIQPLQLAYQGQRQAFTPARVAALPDKVMLVRSRLSRILYRRRFFDYPLKLNAATLGNLGPVYTASIAGKLSESEACATPARSELEDFLVNRFGEKLYTDVLQGLHGEGLGRRVLRDQRRVGVRSASRTLHQQGVLPCCCQAVQDGR